MIEELSALPQSIASPHGALEHDLLGPYTGLDVILESRLHHSIVQRKLTPRLPTLTAPLEQELIASFEQYFPVCDDWTEITPFRLFGKIAARISARALVGPELCRNPQWLDISINYTESLFKTIVVLRIFPTWTYPVLSRFLPSYWYGQYYLRSAKALLRPTFNTLLQKSDSGSWTPENNEKDHNVLAWLADGSKGTDRNTDILAHVEVLLALAAVHTTLLRMINVLNEITDHPEYVDMLRSEIDTVAASGWRHTSYNDLYKLDSILRESQRISPPTLLGLKRLFKQDYTFSNGMTFTKGTYVCLPTYAIENDPVNTVNPDTFDGLRSYRLRQSSKNDKEHQFSSFDKTVLAFGYGKSACPGRFFASVIIKMVFVKLLTEYDFKFIPGTQKPTNLVVHEFLFPRPWDKILVKRAANGKNPF
ncbi:Ent-kaurene oxidase protein [Rutstroemia sp. NJR-2017a WRK4]|nr:Ent-kaurene oxidase protein [Rutstroemia sp. NJR-2017a WRK4]